MNITTYTRGDEIKIISLFKEVFGRDMNLAFWEWRFLENPINKIMIRLMWDGQKLVGHYAVSPVMLSIGNNIALTGLSMTTMTHPDYNGKGIFTNLAEELYQSEYKQNDLQAVWGFPNNNSHAGFIKNLRWVNLPVIPTFSLETNRIMRHPPKSEEIKIIELFTIGHESAYSLITSPYCVKTHKTVDYLNWRYFKNPYFKYTVFEFKHENNFFFSVVKLYATSNFENEIDIVEFIFPDNKEAIHDLIHHILAFYSEHKIVKVNIWLPLNDLRHLTLEKIGFKNDLPITYMGVRAFSPQFSEYLGKCGNWFFSMGDSDVF